MRDLCLPLREVVSWNTQCKCFLFTIHKSTSAWGSELKFPYPTFFASSDGLPLREVVSWNEFIHRFFVLSLCLPLREVVSWNKNTSPDCYMRSTSTSAWGSELKYFQRCCSIWSFWSTSAWGSELKYEDVRIIQTFRLSTSAWGSELKCVIGIICILSVLSTSAWGSELKCGNWKIMNRGIQTSTSAWGSELKYAGH